MDNKKPRTKSCRIYQLLTRISLRRQFNEGNRRSRNSRHGNERHHRNPFSPPLGKRASSQRRQRNPATIDKQLIEAEKEYKSLRKQIQEKLIKFATRIPVFMYLTDYREKTLKEVITQLEPALFKKVTGLHVTDFERLVSLNVFNSALMNDAVYKFKRYEDSSLSYTGTIRHQNENIGLYDTVISKEDIQRM